MPNIDVSKLTPYVITLDRNSPKVDIGVMKNHGVVGALIEAGYLFTATHTRLSTNTDWYRNPHLIDQIKAVEEQDLDYGLYFYARARNSSEVNEEIDGISVIIRNHYLKLGVWIVPNLTNNISTNDALLDLYYKKLSEFGISGRIGLYCNRDFLKNKITWSRHYLKWYLWLVDHVDDVSTLDKLLTPEVFDVEI